MLPQGRGDLAHPPLDVHDLFQGVARRRQHETEEEVLVPLRQVLTLRDQQPAQSHRGQAEAGDDRDARRLRAEHAMDEIGNPLVDPPRAIDGAPQRATALLPRPVRGAAQDLVGQAGDDRDGDDQAQPHGAADGQGDVAEELPHLALDEDDRDEDGDGGQRAGQDGAPDLSGPLEGGGRARLAHLAMAVDVLQHDDRVVHDHAAGKGHAGQADHVERAAEEEQAEEPSDETDRDGHGDDQRAGPAAQEEQQGQDGEDAADDDALQHELNCADDVVGLPVDREELESLRSHALLVELLHRLQHAVHDLEDVGARLLRHGHGQHRLALVEDLRVRLAVAQLGPPHVAQVDRHAVAHGDDDVLDVFGRAVLADGAHQVAPLSLVEVATAVVAVLAVDRRGDLAHRHLPGGQLGRAHDHVHLALAPAEDQAGRDAGHTLDLGFDELVEEIEVGPDLALGAALVQHVDHEPGDGVVPRGIGANDRLVGVGRVGRHLIQPVGGAEQRGVDVGPDLEGQPDRARAVLALALHLDQAFERLELLLLLLYDLALDLQRAGAGPDCRYGDDRVLDVGGELHGQAENRDAAEEQQQDDAHRRGDRVAYRSFDDFHGRLYSSGSPCTGIPGNSRSLPRVTIRSPAPSGPCTSIHSPRPWPPVTGTGSTVWSSLMR